LVAGVEEQLRVGGLVDERAGGVDVALADEDRVGLHGVDLDRHPIGPRPEVRRGHAGVEEQRAPGARPGLGQFLRGDDAERAAGVPHVSG
jgi:hypothetical protein